VGSNADLPAQWLIYITVPDLEESLRQCRAAKGEVLTKIKPAGEGRCAVIRDPAGAVARFTKTRHRKRTRYCRLSSKIRSRRREQADL